METCVNSGYCSGPDICTCNEYWTGALCEIPVCDPACEHGTCVEPNVCLCDYNWGGGDCNTPLCEQYDGCVHGECLFNGNRQYCFCHLGWGQEKCDSKCQYDGSFANTWFYLSCEDLFCGPDYATVDYNNYRHRCSGNGHCSTATSFYNEELGYYSCECDDGTSGELCNEIDVELCPPEYLYSKDRYFDCICPHGWEGEYCENKILNENCDEGYYGRDCEGHDCFGIPYGNSSVCSRHGSCLNPDECRCRGVYEGENCEITPCNPRCINGECIGPYICKCNEGWEGIYCETPVCSQPCINGRICVSPDTCECEEGYFGDQCEMFICDPECFHGTCDAPNICDCSGTGYYGHLCEEFTCVPPCENGGSCTDLNVCDCTGTGYDGNLCTSPICDPPCEHGGTCTSPGDCDCDGTGYDGDQCQIPVCDPPCEHGTCTSPL